MLPSEILVPTDFSNQSDVASRFGFEIASKLGVPLTLLHVLEPPYEFPSRKEEILTLERAQVKKKLEKIRDGFLGHEDFKDVKVEIKISVGLPTQTILDEVNAKPDRMVALGVCGEKRLKHMIYGSTTHRILMESDAPVLSVSDQLDYRAIERIVFASDFREEDARLLSDARDLADILGASLECVHIQTPDEDEDTILGSRSELEGALDYRVSVQILKDSEFLEGISRYLRIGPRSLLMIGRYETSFLNWLMSRTTASELTTVARVPLVMLPGSR